MARSFIEVFLANKTYGVITSHLGPLKSGWNEQSGLLNGSLEYDPKTGRPTYHFISGVAGDSLALQTAKRVGVKEELVRRAIELLSPSSKARHEALEQIETLKMEISKLQDTLKKDIITTQAQKLKYEKLLSQFEREKEEWLSKTVRKAEKRVEEAMSQAKVDDTFKRHRNLQEIKYQLPEIVKAKPITFNSLAESADEFGQKFPPGSKVFVPRLNQDGIVQSFANARGEVLVLSNSIRLQIQWQELKPPGQPSNPSKQILRQTTHYSMAVMDEDRNLDLRGKTVEEAIEELEATLDRAAVQKEGRIKIIHGHGTEALKKAIRSYLSRSVYVKKWKSGSSDQGGDGITWVELNVET